MNNYKDDYIQYRIQKSDQAYSDAKSLASLESWNGSINRLYYACYYIVSALILQKDLDSKTHSGLKTQFNFNFIKTGLISTEFGKLYSDLFDSRQKGDYGDLFDFDRETVESLLEPVGDFIAEVKKNLQK